MKPGGRPAGPRILKAPDDGFQALSPGSVH
jgi:hypothetical protein